MALVAACVGVDIVTCQFPASYTVATILGTLPERQVETVTKQNKTRKKIEQTTNYLKKIFPAFLAENVVNRN